MFTAALLVIAFAFAPPQPGPRTGDHSVESYPRDCPYCGVYGGPNQDLVYDPLLLQADIWPEFNAASCRFEVASYAFVTLGRNACAAERAYRTAMPRAASAPPSSPHPLSGSARQARLRR